MDALLTALPIVVTSAESFYSVLVSLIGTGLDSDLISRDELRVYGGKSFTSVQCAMVTSNNPRAQTALTPGEYLRVYDGAKWCFCRVERLLKCLDQGGYFMVCRLVRSVLLPFVGRDGDCCAAFQYVEESLVSAKLPGAIHSKGLVQTSTRKASTMSV
jgi:hypothetical protein